MLVGHELRKLARSPVALAVTFVAPVLAAMIASAAFGSPPTVDATIVVVGADTQLADLGDLASLATGNGNDSDGDRDEMLEWVTLDDPARARAMVSAGDASAALVLPSPSDPDGAVEVVVNRNERITAKLAESAARTVASRLGPPDVATSPASPANGVTGAVTDADTDDATVPSDVHVTEMRRPPLRGVELYGPVIAVFFGFLTTAFVGQTLHTERERGTLARLRTLPVGTGTIVTGKAVTVVAVGFVEVVTVLVAMRVFYGARTGSLLALAVVIAATVLAIGAISLMIAAVARTQAGVHNAEVYVALGLGVLGGQIIPLHSLPDFFHVFAKVMPNGVAIDAMRDLAAGGRGLGDVSAPIAMIVGFAVVLSLVTYGSVRKAVES